MPAVISIENQWALSSTNAYFETLKMRTTINVDDAFYKTALAMAESGSSEVDRYCSRSPEGFLSRFRLANGWLTSEETHWQRIVSRRGSEPDS